MNPDRFKESPSGRLIKIGQGEATYWAFVPNPLPPEIPPDVEIMSILSEADRALGELAGLGRSIPNPRLLIGLFTRREAVLSSRIEGTQAELADLYAYEAGQLPLPGFKTSPQESDVKEVLNYVRALEYGLERMRDLPLSSRLMRELHSRMLEGVRGEHATPGEFRATQNWIGPPSCTLNQATFVPPPVAEMNEALGAFERYLHDESNKLPLLRLAYIHYQFEAIHPFIDGNGRVGRLLLSLLMVNWNLLPLPLLYLSVFFERYRQEYYDLLLAVSERGAWREWLMFFLRGVAEQSRDAIMRAKQLQDLQSKWRQQLQETRVPIWQLGIVDFLFDLPVLSANDIQKRFHVSHPTAVAALKKLEDMHIVEEYTGRERNRLYRAKAILQTLV